MAGPIKRYCELLTTGYRIRCGDSARFFVTYFVDGSGGKSCCTQHLGKAVHAVLDTPPADPTGTVKVIRIGGRS